MLERILDAILSAWARVSDRTIPWPRLPFILSLGAIIGHRVNLRHGNLIDTETAPPDVTEPRIDGPPEGFDTRGFRTPDGSFNDLEQPWMGMAGTRFGRNVPLKHGYAERDEALMHPNPREISNQLMARGEFIPVPYLNLLAAAWIQFMVHDWLGHGANDRDRVIDIPVPDGDVWPPGRPDDQPNGPLRVLATRADPRTTPADELRPVTFRNVETHWWDGSQIYGSSRGRQERVRALRLARGAARVTPARVRGRSSCSPRSSPSRLRRRVAPWRRRRPSC